MVHSGLAWVHLLSIIPPYMALPVNKLDQKATFLSNSGKSYRVMQLDNDLSFAEERTEVPAVYVSNKLRLYEDVS